MAICGLTFDEANIKIKYLGMPEHITNILLSNGIDTVHDLSAIFDSKKLKDAKVCNCLTNMRIDTEQYNFTAAGIPLIKKAHIICDDIKFHCTKKPEQHHSIWDCIDNMCKGKCPYKIAHKLYPNKYKTK